jgi:hypothetical protein
MDQEILVADLKKLVRKLQQKKGPVALAMLLAPDVDTLDSWNLIVSAKGFDTISRAEALRLLTKLVRDTVGRKNWHTITRVTVLKTNDPFVKAMNQAFSAEHSAVNIQSCNIFGIEIPRAILFESQQLAA